MISVKEKLEKVVSILSSLALKDSRIEVRRSAIYALGYRYSIERKEGPGDAVNIDDEVAMDSEENGCEIPDVPGQLPTPKKSSVRRGAVPALLKAIRDEAEKHSLPEKYFVTSDRTIRNWLNGKGAPEYFCQAVLESHETIERFAKIYIEGEVAKGSSELAANAKKEISLNPEYHALNLDTPEDALLMSEAYRELAELGSGICKLKKRRHT